jgi:isocitrate/isopropylmalate dehydrogenase
VALLRYGWIEEAAAARLERAIHRATSRRRTPDMGGLNTMFEVTRAVLYELQHGP